MGNGPEALVQTVVYALAAYLLIPPVRKFVNAHIKGIHQKIAENDAAVHEKLDAHHVEKMKQAQRHHDEMMNQTEFIARDAPDVAQARADERIADLARRKAPLKRSTPAKKAT